MPDWSDTLDRRRAGLVPGFVGQNEPLEPADTNQDPGYVQSINGVRPDPATGNVTGVGTGDVSSQASSTPAAWTWGQVGVGGTAKTYHRYASGHATADWFFKTVSGTFESGVYTDYVQRYGYNEDSGTSPLDLAEPSLFVQMESKFRQNSGSPYGSEYHLNFRRPGQPNSGLRRPISIFLQHAADLVDMAFSFDTMTMADAAGVQRLNYASGTFTTVANWTHAAPTSGSRIVSLVNNVGSSILSLDSTANDARITFARAAVEKWYLYMAAGADNLLFRDIVNARTTVQITGGVDSLSSQLQLRAMIRHNDSTLFQTTVGAAGAGSALPATPTKYLKFYDNAGATFVVPCYAAS